MTKDHTNTIVSEPSWHSTQQTQLHIPNLTTVPAISANNRAASASAIDSVGAVGTSDDHTSHLWTKPSLLRTKSVSSQAESHVSSNASAAIHDRVESSSRASTRSTTSNVTSQQAQNPSGSSQQHPSPVHFRRPGGQRHLRHYLHSIQSSTPAPTVDTVQYNNIVTKSPPVNQATDNDTLTPGRTSILISRSNTAPSPKRPPASHSSYGVGTTAGPPPSFDTRRTLSTERVWSSERSKPSRTISVSAGASIGTTTTADVGSGVEIHQSYPQPQQPLPPTPTELSNQTQPADLANLPLAQSSSEDADYQTVTNPIDDSDGTSAMDFGNERGLSARRTDSDNKSSNGSQKSEDLFLNIARHDGTRPSSSREERRRSRASIQYFAAPRPASSHNSRAVVQNSESSAYTSETEIPAYRTKSSNLQFGQLRGSMVDDDPTLTAISGDEQHYSNRDTLRPTTRSSIIYRGNRLASDAGYIEKSRYNDQTATESTTSTNAPSTVWDELDDLKSRIRKLELTGKLPASSAAAMSTADRPRTATTAATTLSSSPKHNKTTTPLQATFEGVSPVIHPLLHEALGNAKTVVSHDVYQKLQATAQDALQLASLTSFDTNSVRSGAQSTNERQIRRRTESMCRSLTELAIALASETKSSAPSSYRPPSREYSGPGSGTLRSRRYSQGNESTERSSASMRIQSRLESRRTSTQYAYANARHTSPEVDSPTALPQYPGSGSRITRAPAGIRARRATNYVDSGTEQEESSPAIRPVSRAQTDVSAARRGSRDTAAFAREYTAKHPMPSTTNTEIASSTRTPMPSNLSTNFLSRRKNISPGTNYDAPESSPLAPRQSLGRISIVQHNPNTSPLTDLGSEGLAESRSASSRRSLGIAGRLGSVGNRLRGTRTERIESRTYRGPQIPVDPASIVM